MLDAVRDQELGVVVLASRENPSPLAGKLLRQLLAISLDHKRIAHLSTENKVAPLVASTLRHLGCIAPELDAFLHTYDDRRLCRSAYRMAVSSSCLSQWLAEAEIPFIHWKGSAFAQRYYDDSRLRLSGDIDLLVKPQDWKRASRLLRSKGFRPFGGPEFMQAKARHSGKAEFFHPELRVSVEFNWLFTGNAGIGTVVRPFAEVWQRASRLSEFQYQLCHEDELLETIRHAGHGHAFERIVVRACADAGALLKRTGGSLDWAYVLQQARASECTRLTALFSHFFDAHYRDDTMPAFSDYLWRFNTSTTLFECRLYSQLVLVPLSTQETPRTVRQRLRYAYVSIAGKLWSADSLRRAMLLFVGGIWPTRDALIHIFNTSVVDTLLQRIRYQFTILPLVFPALALGVVGYVFGFLARLKR